MFLAVSSPARTVYDVNKREYTRFLLDMEQKTYARLRAARPLPAEVTAKWDMDFRGDLRFMRAARKGSWELGVGYLKERPLDAQARTLLIGHDGIMAGVVVEIMMDEALAAAEDLRTALRGKQPRSLLGLTPPLDPQDTRNCAKFLDQAADYVGVLGFVHGEELPAGTTVVNRLIYLGPQGVAGWRDEF